ncbi:DNA binding domain-containing protein, excisionase family [Sphingomonas guangdongensis]|uniref:DNA binding domain-containing protein, excisionase family n=1 Tax=Sphingomonas guangdongensis TaxID=1141890 RepID=A0A285R2H6_9SPHN|nr:helix-turn-helix domain-containing protein [Sphingomonas guangdongensis]SOB88303.1 DNA binding domain-containing protein, excisionase family [Sphingomonas guangdongensis]
MTLTEDLLTGADAAAEFLGLRPRQVYRLVEEGHLPVVRKGRMLFFRKSELERAFTSAA